MPSTVVSSMHYDPSSATLRIVFVSGMIYDYLNVPTIVYNAMKAARSKGKYLNEKIKGKFPFRHIR